MSAMSDYLENALINHIFRNTDFTRPANIYAAAYTAAPSDAGGGTEVAGGSYARVAIATGASSGWDAASGGATANTAVATFPTATANWGEILAMGLLDASSAGNLMFWGWLATLSYTFTGANTGDLFTAPGHTLANGDRVILKGSALPTGVSADTVYYVISMSGNTFQLSLTSGGAAIALTADGAGVVWKLAPKTVSNGDIFRFNAGDLDVALQ